MDGPKKWQIELEGDIVDLAWCPDGQSLAVICNPAKIHILSIQDGREHRQVHVKTQARPTTLWWFHTEKETVESVIPDIFKRGGVVTGSTHCIFKSLPLLDPFQDASDQITATDLFAFQGSKTRAPPKRSLPTFISTWPSLPTDLLAASISPYRQGKTAQMTDQVDRSIEDSILALADEAGQLHLYLDGCYPLGVLTLPAIVHSLFKHPQRPEFMATLQSDCATDTWPIHISVPFLRHKALRDFAKLSSTAKELAQLACSVVLEMKRLYLDNTASDGGVGLVGKLWLDAIAEKLTDHASSHGSPLLDLMSLLVSGRTSEPVAEFLSSGPGMSERGIKKWESVVSEGLCKIRDYAEKSLAPTCQRLHLVLEELYAWSLLKPFCQFHLDSARLLDLQMQVARIIVLCAWLAAQLRLEEFRFKEFIAWIIYENAALQPNSDPQRNLPQYDLLDVSDYLTDGITDSPVRLWFTGAKSTFDPYTFSTPPSRPLHVALDEAIAVAGDQEQMAFQVFASPNDWHHLDRNICDGVVDLASEMHDLFDQVSGTGVQDATLTASDARPAAQPELSGLIFRERIVHSPEEDKTIQYITTLLRVDSKSLVAILRLEPTWNGSKPPRYEMAMLECFLPEGTPLRMCAIEWFDDENAVAAFQVASSSLNGPVFIGMLPYSDLSYHELDTTGPILSREQILSKAVERYKTTKEQLERVLITRYRRLTAVEDGDLRLAVNGRSGRQTACVVDRKGSTFESLDMAVGDESSGNESN